MTIKEFIKDNFPKNKEWDNVSNFILESGIEFTDDLSTKWLVGYTNILKSSKPHHKDPKIRKMEEDMFMLHDVVHQIFTLETNCDKDEYVTRQIYGELFTFYLTEFVIPNYFEKDLFDLIYNERDCYKLMADIMLQRPTDVNEIDYLYSVFIKNNINFNTNQIIPLRKYRRMFQTDYINSMSNYDILPSIESRCIVGPTSQNHITFFDVVKKGAIKNIKRELNLVLPPEWK